MKTLADQLDQIIENSGMLFSDRLNWDFKPSPEKWSGKQILGHLIDSAFNNIQRFIRATHEQDFKIVYNQDEWVNNQHYDKANIDELIQLWTLLNRQIIHIWSYFPAERMHIRSDTGQQSKTITRIAEEYIVHLNHHLNQVIRVTVITNI